MDFLLDLVKGQLVERLERTVKDAVAPLPNYLRRLGIGTAILGSSLVGWIGMLNALIVAFFLSLSPLRGYTHPALWTALLCFSIGLVLTLVGLALVRKPRL